MHQRNLHNNLYLLGYIYPHTCICMCKRIHTYTHMCLYTQSSESTFVACVTGFTTEHSVEQPMRGLIPGRDGFSFSQQSVAPVVLYLGVASCKTSLLLGFWPLTLPLSQSCCISRTECFTADVVVFWFLGSFCPSSEIFPEIQMQEPVMWLYLLQLDSTQFVDLCLCPAVVFCGGSICYKERLR